MTDKEIEAGIKRACECDCAPPSTGWTVNPFPIIRDYMERLKRLTAERNDSKIEYHGYHTYVRYSAADKVLCGKIEGIKDLVNFESESAVEIENEFHKAVDDYIAFCREVGKNVVEVEE